MSEYSLNEFLQMAAVRLTNEYVKVETDVPHRGLGDAGVLLDDVGDGFSIKIHPEAVLTGAGYKGDDGFLKLFLHECAHVRLHSDFMQRGEVANMTSEERQRLENEANWMTNLWYQNHANKWQAENYNYVSDMVISTKAGQGMAKQLTALMDVRPDIQEKYDRQVLGVYRNTDELAAEMTRLFMKALKRKEEEQLYASV